MTTWYAVDTADIEAVIAAMDIDEGVKTKMLIDLKAKARPLVMRPSKAAARSARTSGLGHGVYVCNVGLEFGFKPNADGTASDHSKPYNRIAWCGRSYPIYGKTVAERDAKYEARMAAHREMFESAVTKSGKRKYPDLCLDNVLPENRRECSHSATSAAICFETK